MIQGWNRNLWKEFHFRSGHTAKNRIVMAPMTNGQSPSGELSEEEYQWLARRIAGDFGLVVTCAAHVVPSAQAWAGEMGVFSDSHKLGLARLAETAREHGCLVLPQLFHGGFRSPRALTGVQPVSASEFDLDVPDFERPRSLSSEEIHQLIEAFGAAARRVVDSGLPGVEVHGANGYLFTQFLSPLTNRRTDSWGGSSVNRARFLLETVAKVRKTIGPRKMLGVRLSPENTKLISEIDIREMTEVAYELEKLGVDYISISLWDALKLPDQYPDSRQTIIEIFREALSGETPILVSGQIWDAERAQRVLDLGGDFVVLGAAAIANPDWPRRARDPGFKPTRFPLTRSQFHELAVSDVFVNYLSRWGFVAAE